jgi:uncharacterized radical SAM superfamily Fe-S cluster-containing enzyme
MLTAWEGLEPREVVVVLEAHAAAVHTPSLPGPRPLVVQHACLRIIEVNTGCNLDCPICFADSGWQLAAAGLERVDGRTSDQ